MGTWSTNAPTNTYGNWTSVFSTSNDGYYRYKLSSGEYYYANFTVRADCSAIRLADNKICVKVACYSKRSSADNNTTSYGHYLYSQPYVKDENGSWSYGTQVDGKFTDSYINPTTQYYTFPSTYHPTSIVCGNTGSGYSGNGDAQVTITVIPNPAGALIWFSDGTKWHQANIFYSNGSAWKQAIIFDTKHLP